MAEEERLTKRERRELARQERREKAAEEAKRARKRRITSWTVGAVVTALVVAILVLAFTGGPSTIDDIRIVDPAAAAEAREANGCTQLAADVSGNNQHFDAAEAPPAETLYTLRPTASGPHFTNQIAPGVYAGGMDERGSTHSMEHGAVIVWYDEGRLDGDAIDDIHGWVESLNASGFVTNRLSGAGMFAAPFEGEFTSGKPLALRAWGAALDCDSWEGVIGDAFAIDHFGTHGIAPEATIGGYPEGVLRFGPGADQTEVPNGRQGSGGAPAPEPTGGEDTEPAEDGGTEPADEGTQPTDEATGEGTDTTDG